MVREIEFVKNKVVIVGVVIKVIVVFYVFFVVFGFGFQILCGCQVFVKKYIKLGLYLYGQFIFI